MRIYRVFRPALALLLMLPMLAASLGSPLRAQAAETPELKRALLATAHIVVPIDGEDDMASAGSGSVLTSDGYILTNWHVMADTEGSGDLYNSEGMAAIGINNPSDLHALPTFSYKAVLVKGDPDLDLAVLKITAPLNKKGTLPKDLGLVTMPLGDSGKLEFDDNVRCLGYPGIGGDSVTFTKGTVAGFMDEDGDGKNEWIKTDAEINHGNSGGAAINDKGEIIGVPTANLSEQQAQGKLSLIRPINLALPLVQSAIRGLDDDPNHQAGSARVTNLIFTDNVDRKGRAGKPVSRFDSGSDAIYAVFDFEGFADGQTFSWRWERDGKKVYADSMAWDQGTQGTAWVSLTSDEALDDGSYQLALTLDDQALTTARIAVGKGSDSSSAAGAKFEAPVFAEGVNDADEPVKPHAAGEPFDSGTTKIYAFFDYSGMSEGLTYSYRWLLDGEEVLARDRQWESTASGNFWLQINSDKGLPDGHYQFETSIAGQPAMKGEFDIGDGGSSPLTDDGVQVIGTVSDADTERAIGGALLVALVPGTDVDEFLADPQESQIYASGTADRKGSFSLDKLLERGSTYTLVAVAKGYQPAMEDNLEIGNDTESPLEMTVKLQKR